MAQWQKNLPAMQEPQEMRVWSLGWDDPLKKEKETHSSILPWRIPWTEEPGGLQCIASQRVGQDWSDLALYAISKHRRVNLTSRSQSKEW